MKMINLIFIVLDLIAICRRIFMIFGNAIEFQTCDLDLYVHKT